MSVQVSYKKQLLLGIILLAIIIVVLEVIATISLYFYDFCSIGKKGFYQNLDYYRLNQLCLDDSQIYFDYKPNLYIQPNQHYPTININNDGFRGPEISKEKPSNTYRIFVIGGSTVYGILDRSDQTTISGYLQQKFDESHLPFKIEVINAGISAAFSYTETKYIKDKLLNYNPDLIIVYDGNNDLDRSYDEFNQTLGKRSIEADLTWKFSKILPFIQLRYVAGSILTDIENHGNQVNYAIPFNSSNLSEKTSIWTERWKEICELDRQKGVDTIVVLQPIIGSGNKTLSPLEHQYFMLAGGEKRVLGYNEFANKLDELKDHCTVTADLRTVFDKESDKSIFQDFVHVIDDGNKIISDKLFEISMPIVKQKLS